MSKNDVTIHFTCLLYIVSMSYIEIEKVIRSITNYYSCTALHDKTLFIPRAAIDHAFSPPSPLTPHVTMTVNHLPAGKSLRSVHVYNEQVSGSK